MLEVLKDALTRDNDSLSVKERNHERRCSPLAALRDLGKENRHGKVPNPQCPTRKDPGCRQRSECTDLALACRGNDCVDGKVGILDFVARIIKVSSNCVCS